jgi:uncharacterized membrane protein YfcA
MLDINSSLALIAGGVGAGVIAATVGGGSLVTYPVLLGLGVPPLAATIITNTALVPSNFVAALADRTQLPRFDAAFIRLMLVSIAGSTAGALLLLATPHRVFEAIIPILLAFATVLFASSHRIAEWLKSRAERRGVTHDIDATSAKLVLPISFYGGYFGSGLGILLMAVFSMTTGGNYRMANVIRNLISSVGSVSAVVIYVLQDAVWWPQTILLAIGAIAGGYAGSWIARYIPRDIGRVLVTLCGVALTTGCIYRYWL